MFWSFLRIDAPSRHCMIDVRLKYISSTRPTDIPGCCRSRSWCPIMHENVSLDGWVPDSWGVPGFGWIPASDLGIICWMGDYSAPATASASVGKDGESSSGQPDATSKVSTLEDEGDTNQRLTSEIDLGVTKHRNSSLPSRSTPMNCFGVFVSFASWRVKSCIAV